MLLNKMFVKFRKGTENLQCCLNLRKTGNTLRYKAFLSLKDSIQHMVKTSVKLIGFLF